MKAINLNDRVRVTLTANGRRHFRHFEDAQAPSPTQPRGSVWEGPLWELMLVFGEGCYMGACPVFMDNAITLLEQDGGAR